MVPAVDMAASYPRRLATRAPPANNEARRGRSISTPPRRRDYKSPVSDYILPVFDYTLTTPAL